MTLIVSAVSLFYVHRMHSHDVYFMCEKENNQQVKVASTADMIDTYT